MPFAWAAGISAAAGLVGGALQGQAAGAAADKATAAQREAQERARADLQPWMTTGGLANTETAALLGLSGQDASDAARARFQTSPGYQFQLTEGLKAVDAGAAARGMLTSGGTQRGEMRFASGLADQEFGDYYNRLFNLSQLGQKSAAGTAEGEIQTGRGIATAESNLGQQQASIYGNVASGIGSAANSYATNTLYQDMYKDRTAALASRGGALPPIY